MTHLQNIQGLLKGCPSSFCHPAGKQLCITCFRGLSEYLKAVKTTDEIIDNMQNLPVVKGLMKNTEWKNGWDNACEEVKKKCQEAIKLGEKG